LIEGNPKTEWITPSDPSPKEIVLSFCDHDSVLIDQVKIRAGRVMLRDVEVWVSSSGPADGFQRVATTVLPEHSAENTIRFEPVEAKYVKVRLLHNYDGQEVFYLWELKVMEAQRSGYTP